MKNVLYVVVIVCIMGFVVQDMLAQEYVYTSQSPTILREQPGETANVLQELPQGEKLIVLEKQPDWIKVLYNATMGYIASSQVTSSAPPDQIPFVDIGDLRNQYKTNKDTMTKVKFQGWWEDTQKNLMNHRIRSQGYVEQAKESWADGLHVQVNIDPLSENTPYDAILRLDKERHKDVLPRLIKGERVEFIGQIESITTTLGLFVVRFQDIDFVFEEQTSQQSNEQQAPKLGENATVSQAPLEELDLVALFTEYKTNKEKMTKAGFETWWTQTQDALKAKERIHVKGYVYDADKAREGISLDINAFPESERDQYAKYGRLCSVMLDEAIYKSRVASLQKYDIVEFTGKVSNIVTSLGLFIVEMQQGELVNIEPQAGTRVKITLPEGSATQPPFINFAELLGQYGINEGKLTDYGFKTWKGQLNALISEKTIASQGTVVDAKMRGDNVIEIQLDIHIPPDQKSEITLKLNKGTNQDIIMKLDKGTSMSFTGLVKWWTMNAKRMMAQIENGIILERPAESSAPQESAASQASSSTQALTSNDLLCKFVLGLVSDDVILTNNAGRDLKNVKLTITLDEGNVSDTIPTWLNHEEKKYTFKGVRTTKTIQIELLSDDGTLSHVYPSGH